MMDIFVEIISEDGKYSFKERLDDHYVESIVEDGYEYYKPLQISINDVREYNGSHFIFGYIEALMQSYIFPHDAFRDYDNLIIKTSVET